MANVKILGSSSKGNCYLLETKKETLIIEAGISLSQIKKGLNFDISKVVGCLVTHEHGDHSKAMYNVAKSGIKVYASKGTIESQKEKHHNFNIVRKLTDFKIGGFRILPFDTQHDCKEPLGFLIEHKEIGRMLFATDTYYIKYSFKNIDHCFVECNYMRGILEDNLQNGLVYYSQGQRLLESHFELENVIEFLKSSISGNLKNVVLLHLSDRNIDREIAKNKIKKVIDFEPIIAGSGVNVNIDKVCFWAKNRRQKC